MSVTVVGSLAFDALETPFGKRDRILGGAATHFSLAASYFTDVFAVGVVGEDFGEAEFAVYAARGINVDDVERVPGGRSFFWAGRYGYDLEMAETLETDLNVFADFKPSLSPRARSSSILFLANIQPELQRDVREQCSAASFVALDSMNYWIESDRDALVRAMELVDCVILNDAEVRMLAGEPNLATAAKIVRGFGPRVVVVKQGQYGACLFTETGFFSIPGYPLETVVDPTGAGDAFAGGMLGYLASRAGEPVTDPLLRCAMVYGSVLASFNVEAFGSERLQRLTHPEINARFTDFHKMTSFEPLLVSPRHVVTKSTAASA
jgi:sugar/nucleoside kinase (ribokinase family)